MTKKDELYELVIAEKERTIQVLIDTVDYLRAELSIRPRTFEGTTNVRSEIEEHNQLMFDMSGGMQAWVSEEEQDIRAMVESGHLTKEDAEAALTELLGLES